MRRSRTLALVLAAIALSGSGTRAGPTACGDCPLCGDNPAAHLRDFYVLSGSLVCEMAFESNVMHYLLETTANPDFGVWRQVGAAWPAGGRSYTRPVPAGCESFLRLVEVDQEGTRRVIGHAPLRHDASTPRYTRSAPTLEDLVKHGQEALAQILESPGPRHQRHVGESIVVYGPTVWLSPDYLQCAFYWDALGYTVLTESIDAFADVRAEVAASIVGHAAQGVRYFLLIGDAGDRDVFEGSLAGEYWIGEWEDVRQGYLQDGYQSATDVIPTFFRKDNAEGPGENMAYDFPYYTTDQPYGDVDGDGRLDVVVTRWPARTTANVVMMSNKVMDYGDSGRFAPGGGGGIVFLDDRNSATGGVQAGVVLHTSAGRMVDTFSQIGLFSFEDAWPGVPGCEEMTSLVVNAWNSFPMSIIGLLGTMSGRYEPGMFLSKHCAVPFDHSMLVDGPQGVVLATSCQSAGFALSQDQAGLPVCEEVMRWDKGAVGWLGATSGTWHTAHLLVQKHYSEAIVEDLWRPAAESWLIAQQRIYEASGGSEMTTRSIEPYVFLGDPLSIVQEPVMPTFAPEREREFVALSVLGVGTPSTEVRVTYAVRVGAPFTVGVYNVGGRRVRLLSEGVGATGSTSLIWDMKDEGGREVASGVFFVRLQSDGRSHVRKVAVVR